MPRSLALRLTFSVVLFAFLFTLALPAVAQYQAAGGITIAESRRSQLEKAIEEARWNLGPFRVQPWFGLHDMAYQDNIPTPDGPVDDIHGTAGAGLKFYLPVGSDVVVAAHALPEYHFWVDLSDRDQVIGRYGLGVFAFLNRLELEVTGRQIESVNFLSSEVLQQVPQTQDILEAKAQVRISGSLAVAVSGNITGWDFEDFEDSTGGSQTDPGLLLDREETKVRAGLRYLLRGEGGYVGVGVQDEETNFDFASDRDNSGTSYYVEALLQGNSLDIAADVTQRQLDPSVGGSFPGFEDTTGSLMLNLHPRSSSEFQVYGRRDLNYSALTGSNYYLADRYGVAINLDLGHRSGLQAFYETGQNDYFSSGPITFEDEDVNAWGASMSYRLGRYLNLRLGYRLTEYDTPQMDRHREIEEILIGIAFGTGPGDW